MSDALTQPAQKSLDRWHAMVASGDMTGLAEIVHPDAVFRSPVAHTPYPGRDALVMILGAVSKVFEDFAYHREFVAESGKDVALEFSARVGEKKLKGADFIKFDDDGLIIEFEVMIRPASGLMALGEEMGKRAGVALSAHKGPQ